MDTYKMTDKIGIPDIGWLFQSKALEIAPCDYPFFYTSGLIGPYYINTHYLCGGRECASGILEFIDGNSADRSSFPGELVGKLSGVFYSDPVYRSVIEALLGRAIKNINDGVSLISGGERRDWFFAPLVARELNLPCLYIYNDKCMVNQAGNQVSNLGGRSVLNISDLLTVGSSYTEKWIPAVSSIGGSLFASISVVNRNQGGEANLRAFGVDSVSSLFKIHAVLFEQALNYNYIDQAQYELVNRYLEDPFKSMRNFLIENPGFLTSALNSSNPKITQRAKLLVNRDLYKLKGIF